MKYLLVALLGLLLGAAAGCLVLYFNPLTDGGSEPGADGLVLRYALPGQVLGFTLGDHALLPGMRLATPGFWEETIDRTAVLGIVLKDDKGRPVAVASRLLAGSPKTDLLLRGVLVHDYWLLTLPEEGSVFVRVDTNLWPFLKHTLLPVWYLGRPWSGPADIQPTAGLGDDSAVVIGATGRFKGVGGSAVEQYRLTALDPASRTATANGELRLNLDNPPAVTAAQ